jgi:hypothetical protein
MNSKQIVAAVSAVILVIILVYPALSTGTVSVSLGSKPVANADHVYVTVDGVWVHEKGQSSTAGWKSVFNQSQVVDLISPTNTTKALATSQLPVADYDAVRLVMSNVTWVFNKNTTQLAPASRNVDANIEFTLAAGKSVAITILLGGSQQTVGPTKFFATVMTVSITS